MMVSIHELPNLKSFNLFNINLSILRREKILFDFFTFLIVLIKRI